MKYSKLIDKCIREEGCVCGNGRKPACCQCCDNFENCMYNTDTSGCENCPVVTGTFPLKNEYVPGTITKKAIRACLWFLGFWGMILLIAILILSIMRWFGH